MDTWVPLPNITGLQSGSVITLKSINANMFLARCNGCVPGAPASVPDAAFAHVPNSDAPYTQFTVTPLPNGKFALRADTGKYLAVCDGCVPGGGAARFTATMHVTDPNIPWAQWTIRPGSAAGTYTLQSEPTGGYFLTPCQGCVPGGAEPYSATLHIKDPNIPWTQWAIFIKQTSVPAPAEALTLPVKGGNVQQVNFEGGGTKLGGYVQTGPKKWVEVNTQGTTTFEFDEVNRDEWSVYLKDPSRNVSIHIDLFRKMIRYSDAQTPWRDQYTVLLATSGEPNLPSDAQPLTVQEEAAIASDPNTIYEDVPNMSMQEIQGVMGWIKIKTTGERLPFCWRQSEGRGVGTIPGRVADCPATYTNNGATCGRGADTIGAPSRLGDCPAGYKNMLVGCVKFPDTYWKPFGHCTTWFKKYPCAAGYTDNGCTCGRGGDSISRDHMTCPSGYHKSPILPERCIVDCQSGYTNTGETCFKGTSTLGMGSMLCKAGEEKIGARCFPNGGSCFGSEEEDAGLCYKGCKAGFNGVGPVCWQNCPANWVNCAAGCAKTKNDCASTVGDQVLSPLIVAANIATVGMAAPETAAVATAAKTTAETITIAGKTYTATSKVGMASVKALKAMEWAAKNPGKVLKQGGLKAIDSLQDVKPDGLEKGASVFRRIYVARTGRTAAASGGKTTAQVVRFYRTSKVEGTIEYDAYRATNDYATAFAEDFKRQTSEEINDAIDHYYEEGPAQFLKETWAKQQLTELAEANGWRITQDVLAVASIVDITGVTGVVSAYAKPICQDLTSFPCGKSTRNCSQ